MFNVFYFVSYTGGFYSFNSRTGGVSPCSTNPLKSLHDCKQNEGVPRVNVSIDFAERERYKVLTRKVTSITQFEERVLVAAGMSMLWAPQNPRGVPVYDYQGKGIALVNSLLCVHFRFALHILILLYFSVGYSLMNVHDPKAGGAMVVAYLPEWKPVWLEQIRDHFWHPTSESLATYANTVLEEVIVLSSEGSDRSCEGLIPRSPRAGPTQGAVNEPVNEPVGDDVDVPTDIAEQLETRKKKKEDKPKKKKKKKKVKEPLTTVPRKQPSNLSFLDYVVVSDMLSGLDAGDKCVERDPDEDATLIEILKKKKVLEDQKKELDQQAAAALAAKNSSCTFKVRD
ncbi:hypothetical protein Hanom_Chr09g00771141 [Helianthus anomalus]